MTMSFFLIFSEHPWDKLHADLPHLQFLANNWVYSSYTDIKLIDSIDTRRSLSMKFFVWPINFGVLSSLLLPHLSSSLTDSLPSLNLLCHSKIDARFMQAGRKAVWSIPYVSVALFPSLKQNLLHIVLLKCPDVQIAFLKFNSCDNQDLVGCIPIASVAVYLNLKS